MSDRSDRPYAPAQALRDVRVLELSEGIAGSYAGKMFADLGASVTKLAAGRSSDEVSPSLRAYLDRGKQHLPAGTSDLDGLLARADLVIDSSPLRLPDLAATMEQHPALVVLTITPFGYHSDDPAAELNDFLAQASGGAIAFHGREGMIPFQAGGRIVEWAAGTFGAAAALAALHGRIRSGHGDHVDCSLQATATFSLTSFVDTRYSMLGGPEPGSHAGIIEVPSVEPTLDGWVGFNTNTRQQFDDFLVLIERPDLLGEAGWPLAEYRIAHVDEWNEIVRSWTSAHTTAEIVERAALFRIPVAPVNDAAGVLAERHFRERGFFAAPAGAEALEPVPPYLINHERVPAAVAETGRQPRGLHSRTLRSDPGQRPLSGLRILDATTFWAGPSVGQFFGMLGAQVWHLESVQRPDGSRYWVGPLADRPQWWERGSLWTSTNSNKKSVTLDLNDPDGRQLAEDLLMSCDVVVENFSPRVFDRFGFDIDSVSKLNPGIVYARMPAFGLSGPWRENVGFAQTMEQATGMAWITGHPDDQPRIPRGPCDPIAGYHAAFAVLAALLERSRTGLGCGIEVAMVEAALSVAAELVLELTHERRSLERSGNRSPIAAPQGVYPCRGDGQWIALSVTSEQAWAGLCRVVGIERQLATPRERRAEHDWIDGQIAGWSASRTPAEACAELQSAGVPVSLLADPRSMSSDARLRSFGYYEQATHPVAGDLALPTVPFRLASVERWITSPAPLLGQHNDEALRDVLGLSPARIQELQDAAVIGDRPTGL